MKRYGRGGWDFGDFEITKREILASVSIIAIMLLIGVIISGKISESQLDANEKYNKAIKIDTLDLFEYGMRTNIGNAFVYGTLEAVDTVTYPEIDGVYMYVEKVKEKYTKHTRTVSDYDEDGNKIGEHEEEYWTWDRVDSEELKCKEISFLGHVFSSDKIDIPGSHYIETIKESSKIRWKYYGVNPSFIGTIFTDLRNGTITNNTPFYDNLTISETISNLESSSCLVWFWIFWIFLTGFCVYGFYYLDNNWLEN